MSTDQTPSRRPAPVTQRDGSSLQNANCRMASIATGIDYETTGSQKSTGAKMRSYTDDQSGGTDSGDAKQSWDRGYDRSLTVRDGRTWSDAMADLRAGRLVHLDVWHATVGGPCLSGSGAYGHTMAVAPDCKDNAWLVADPWCKPGSWVRVAESKLKAGAEEWGSQVYGAAALEADWPTTGGPVDAKAEHVQRVVARVVRRLMSEANPGRPGFLQRFTPATLADTGGGQPILYTVTVAQPLGGDMGILWNPTQWADPGIPLYLDSACTKKITTTTAGGAPLTSLGPAAAVDDNGMDADSYSILVSTSKLATDPAIGNQRAILWAKRTDLPDETLKPNDAWDDSLWALSQDSTGRWPCASGGEDPAEIIAARDDEWMEWLLAGSPAAESDAP